MREKSLGASVDVRATFLRTFSPLLHSQRGTQENSQMERIESSAALSLHITHTKYEPLQSLAMPGNPIYEYTTKSVRQQRSR